MAEVSFGSTSKVRDQLRRKSERGRGAVSACNPRGLAVATEGASWAVSFGAWFPPPEASAVAPPGFSWSPVALHPAALLGKGGWPGQEDLSSPALFGPGFCVRSIQFIWDL